METLTDLHKNLIVLIDKSERKLEDIDIINNYGVTVWLDLWREGLVLTDKNGYAYLTKKGLQFVAPSTEEPL